MTAFVTMRNRDNVPSLVAAMVEVGVLDKKFGERITELYQIDIAAAEERGRMEACDIMETLMGKARKGDKSCSD